MEDALQQVEAQLRDHLPLAALEKVLALDAWGEARGRCGMVCAVLCACYVYTVCTCRWFDPSRGQTEIAMALVV